MNGKSTAKPQGAMCVLMFANPIIEEWLFCFEIKKWFSNFFGPYTATARKKWMVAIPYLKGLFIVKGSQSRMGPL